VATHQVLADVIDVGLGEAGRFCRNRHLVPGTIAWLVVIGQLGEGTQNQAAVLPTEIRKPERRGHGLLLEQRDDRVRLAVVGDRLRHALDQQDAPGEPVLDVLRGDITHRLQVTFETCTDGIALLVVVVERKQRKRSGYDQARRQEDFLAELETTEHERAPAYKPVRSGSCQRNRPDIDQFLGRAGNNFKASVITTHSWRLCFLP